jgi:hypothetical protein
MAILVIADTLEIYGAHYSSKADCLSAGQRISCFNDSKWIIIALSKTGLSQSIPPVKF